MEDEIFDKDLASKVQRVLSKNASNYENHTQDKEWNEIMEETNKEVKKQASRTRMFAVAASILLVAVIGGTVLAVTANGGSKAIKTVDDKDKTPITNKPQETSSTTTTIPLSTEQEILNDSVLVVSNTTGLEVVDGLTKEKLYSLPNNDVTDGAGLPVDVKTLKLSGSQLSINRYSQCDVPYGISSIDIKTGKETYTGFKLRVYSPSGNKYVEIKPSCDTAETATIVDVATGIRRDLKPENIDGTLYGINKVFWIDDARFIYGTTEELFYRIADISKTISLANDEKLKFVGVDTYIADVIKSNGNTYALVGGQSNEDNSIIFSAIEIESEETLWTHKLDAKDKNFGYTFGFVFGNTPTRIYGSLADETTFSGYIYDQPTKTSLRPDAIAAMPKR